MAMLRNRLNTKGQSIVEVLVAMGVISIVMISLFRLFTFSLNLLYESQDRAMAHSLAEEGLEIVKHQRYLGCEFDNIVDEGVNTFTSPENFFVIEEDLTGTAQSLKKYTIDNVPAFNISGYPQGTKRKIYLYSLTDAINQYSFLNNHDKAGESNDDYYFVKAKIEWVNKAGSGQSYELSTIMLKRWKD